MGWRRRYDPPIGCSLFVRHRYWAKVDHELFGGLGIFIAAGMSWTEVQRKPAVSELNFQKRPDFIC